MLPVGMLILGLKLQAQYLAGLQHGAMTGSHLKEHAQRRGLRQGAKLPTAGAPDAQLNFAGQGRLVVGRGARASGACYPDVLQVAGCPWQLAWGISAAFAVTVCCLEAC